MTPYELLLNDLTTNSSSTMEGQLSGDEFTNLINRIDNITITYNTDKNTTTITQN